MRSAARLAVLTCALLSTVVAVGCATKKFQPSPFRPEARKGIPSETTIGFAMQGSACVKSGPYAMIGFNNEYVIWNVTNTCSEPVTVNIERFKVKHKVFHLFPFQAQIPPTTIAAGTTSPIAIKAQVRGSVDEESMKGFQVYKYIVRFRVGNGHDNTDDPEIILDWP